MSDSIQLDADQLLVLRTYHAWLYGQRKPVMRPGGKGVWVHADGPIPAQHTLVPHYLPFLELKDKTRNFDSIVRWLLDAGLLREARYRADVSGEWDLPDGRRIGSQVRTEQRGPNLCNFVEASIVGEKGPGIGGGTIQPFGRCYTLTAEALRLLNQIDKPDESANPAWKRLRIIRGNSGDVAELDGKSHRLSGQDDARFLELLQEAKGTPVKGTDLQTTLNRRPDRIHKQLPKRIKAIVEKPGRGGTGYRML